MHDGSEVQGLVELLRHAQKLVDASSRSADPATVSDDLDVLADAITVVASDVPEDAAWRLCTKLWVPDTLRLLCPSFPMSPTGCIWDTTTTGSQQDGDVGQVICRKSVHDASLVHRCP